MTGDFKSGNVLSKNLYQSTRPEKIDPVQAVKLLQELPDDGKGLPPESEEYVFKSSELDDIVKQLNEYIQLVQRELQFSLHEDSGDSIITMLDKQTGDVIRQIPHEEALDFVRSLNEGVVLELYSAYT